MTSLHEVVRKREWTDPYPDTLRVSLERDSQHGNLAAVFSAQAVWLNRDQLREVIDFLTLLDEDMAREG